MPTPYDALLEEAEARERQGAPSAPTVGTPYDKMLENAEAVARDGGSVPEKVTPISKRREQRKAKEFDPFSLEDLRQAQRMVEQGFTFALGDEAAALGSAAGRAVRNAVLGESDTTASERYAEVHDQEKAKRDEFRRDNPVLSTVLETAAALPSAGVATAVGLGPAAVKGGVLPFTNWMNKKLWKAAEYATDHGIRSRRLPLRMAGAAGTGSAYGGLYGAGAADRGLENRMEGLKDGMFYGGILGAGTPLVAPLVRRPASAIKRLATARQTHVHPRAVDPLQDILERSVKDADAPLPPPNEGSALADQSPHTRALLTEEVSELKNVADPVVKFVEDRAKAAGPRVAKALDDYLGAPEGALAKVERMEAQVAPQRRAAWDRTYATDIDYASTTGRELESIYRDRIPKAVIKKANDLLRLDGKTSRQVLLRFDDNGNVIRESLPDPEQVHYILQALDDRIGTATGKLQPGQSSTEVRKLTGLRSDIRGRVGKLVPAWDEAAALSEPPKVAQEAMERGKKAMSPTVNRDFVEADIKELEKMHPGLMDRDPNFIREHYRLGARNRYEDAASQAGISLSRDPSLAGHVPLQAYLDPEFLKLLKDTSKPGTREKLAALLGDEEASALIKQLDLAADEIATLHAMPENVKHKVREIGKGPERGETAFSYLWRRGGDAKERAMFNPRRRRAEATVTALIQDADAERMSRLLRAREPKERGLHASKMGQAMFGGGKLAAMEPVSEQLDLTVDDLIAGTRSAPRRAIDWMFQ